jgi:hypothetical protein
VEIRHHAAAEAALMLLEALMLSMIRAGLVSAQEMADVVETAIDAKRELVESGQHPRISQVAAGMLAGIANSLAAAR